MDLTIQPKSLSGQETQGDPQKGGQRETGGEGHCGTAIQSVGLRFKECGHQQMPTQANCMVSNSSTNSYHTYAHIPETLMQSFSHRICSQSAVSCLDEAAHV